MSWRRSSKRAVRMGHLAVELVSVRQPGSGRSLRLGANRRRRMQADRFRALRTGPRYRKLSFRKADWADHGGTGRIRLCINAGLRASRLPRGARATKGVVVMTAGLPAVMTNR